MEMATGSASADESLERKLGGKVLERLAEVGSVSALEALGPAERREFYSDKI